MQLEAKSGTYSLGNFKKIVFQWWGGQGTYFLRDSGFIGLDCGKVPTNILHEKQLSEFWPQWEEVWIVPVFVIKLLTQESQSRPISLTNGKATQPRPDLHLGPGRVPPSSPPVLYQGMQAADIFLD